MSILPNVLTFEYLYKITIKNDFEGLSDLCYIRLKGKSYGVKSCKKTNK